MKNFFRHSGESLATKLILAIGVLMVIGSFVFWFAILHKQQKDILSIASKYGNSFVDFVKKRTHNNMLNLQRTEIQQTLEDLSIAEGVQRVQIFNHEGRITYSSDIENVDSFVDRDSLACKGCHMDTETNFQLLPQPTKVEIFKDPAKHTSLRLIEPIYNVSSCYTAACHVHPREQKILGFVESTMSLALLDEATLKQRLALTAYVVVFITAISFSLGIILYKIVSKPVGELTRGMEKVAAGNLDYSVPIKSSDEMGMLATSFNAMIKDLKAARDQRELWTQTLEEEVRKKTEEIQETHASLVQTEKLASLGRMAAGVAHEINNPLTGIVTFAHLMKNNVSADSPEAEDLNIIIEQAERCAKIIKNLLTFARATPSEKGNVNINDLLNRTIYMVRNQAKFHNVKFEINLDESQLVTLGDASQFQQIFLNMFINASDAMNKRGTIKVATRIVPVDNRRFAEIEFTDNGTGIPDEILGKLFEPFFTTKPVGKGTGLGLSVSHGIVKHYGGHIDVKSAIGKGTSFFVRLPLVEQSHQSE